jgi:hypothetical protein
MLLTANVLAHQDDITERHAQSSHLVQRSVDSFIAEVGGDERSSSAAVAGPDHMARARDLF